MNITDEMRERVGHLEAECAQMAASLGVARATWPSPTVTMGGPADPVIVWRGRDGEECDALEMRIARLTVERDGLRGATP